MIRVTLLMLLLSGAAVAMAQTPEPARNQQAPWPNALEGPIKVYQKIVSSADGQRCPMYPSCSTYAQEAFHKKGLMMGWIMTCDRLLRCGRDEVRLSRQVRINGKRLTYDPIQQNDFWWKSRR